MSKVKTIQLQINDYKDKLYSFFDQTSALDDDIKEERTNSVLNETISYGCVSNNYVFITKQNLKDIFENVFDNGSGSFNNYKNFYNEFWKELNKEQIKKGR